MKPSKTILLFELARLGASAGDARVKTIEVAERLGISQQTASRWLAELSADGFVSRKGKRVRLTRSALAEIEALAAALEETRTPSSKEKIVLRGVVVRGLGEGARFMRLPGYARQLRSALGWTPFPGTLNLRLDVSGAKTKAALESMAGGVSVKSFVEGNKRFGSVKLFPCVIKNGRNEERGAAVLPEKSFYGESVLELIAPSDLRKKLELRDHSPVQVKILVFE